MVVLLCPVRGCQRPLARADRRLVCPRQHSFDVARRGYVNLLQPQDRRSGRAGDSIEALQARRRWLERELDVPLIEAIVATVSLSPGAAMLEVGCGEGHQLEALAARWECEGHGLDISVPAIEAAAKRQPRLHWVVANADRRLPYANGSFQLVASILARRNAAEFRRVLRDDGRLLLVVPGPDDLIELRQAVLGEGVLRDRVPAVREDLSAFFRPERHERLRRTARLGPQAIADVMTGSYRGLRARARARLAAVGTLEVTLSRDVVLFQPRP